MTTHPDTVRLALDPTPRAGDYLALLYVLENGRPRLITPDGAAHPARPGGRRPDLVIIDDPPPRGEASPAPRAGRARPGTWWPRQHGKPAALVGRHQLEARAAAVLERLAAGRVRWT